MLYTDARLLKLRQSEDPLETEPGGPLHVDRSQWRWRTIRCHATHPATGAQYQLPNGTTILPASTPDGTLILIKFSDSYSWSANCA